MSRYVVGVGLASAATADEVAALVTATLAEAGIGPSDVDAVATVDGRAAHPAITALGWPVVRVALPVPGPGPDPGRPAVAEPAALAAAGAGSVLVVPKRRSARATAAIARIGPVTASGR